MTTVTLTRCWLAAALVMMAVWTTVADAKGSFGSVRSVSGGYFRSGKSGYYSRNYRYSTNYMYWGYYGNYYHHAAYSSNPSAYAGYSGPANRVGTQTFTEDEAKDIFCRRRVTPLNDTSFTTSYTTLNSTQYCMKQLYALPGDPGNIPVESLMLDRYVFNFTLGGGYPTIDLVVYPDKDISVPDVNVSLRLSKLTFNTARNTTSSPLATIDLASLVWKPCTLASCNDAAATSQWGRPSSRFIDNDRVMSVAVSAVWSSALRVTVRAWLSNDFDQDPYFDNVVLLPSLVKIDVTMEAVKNASSIVALNGAYVGLEAVVATVSSGEGSSANMVNLTQADYPIQHDPLKMARVNFGSYQDQQVRKGAVLSWFTSINHSFPCYSESDTHCANFLNWAGLDNATCVGNASDPAVCADLLRANQTGRSVEWMFQQPVTDEYTGRFYMHFGFVDPATQFPPITDGARSVTLMVAMAVLILAMVGLV